MFSADDHIPNLHGHLRHREYLRLIMFGNPAVKPQLPALNSPNLYSGQLTVNFGQG